MNLPDKVYFEGPQVYDNTIMRLNNLPTKEIEKVKSGNIRVLGDIIDRELSSIKDDLINLPLSKVEELRGQAKALQAILKLLP